MKGMTRFAALAVLLTSLSALPEAARTSHAGESKTASDAEWSELMGNMEKMQAAMASIRRSGESDVDFVRLMLPHHQAAIDMAKSQLLHGKDPRLRRLAQEIITDQQSEIELMQLWLTQHEPSTPKTTTDGRP